MNTGFRQATQAALDGLDGRQRLGGIPLGRLQVFAPIRMGNVPDCPSRQGPLGCAQRESPLEEGSGKIRGTVRSEEHTSELQSRLHLVCRLLLEKKKNSIHTESCAQLQP